MNSDSGLKLLFQYASTYKFSDFDKLFTELTPHLAVEELCDALLMRAQIKLFAADETLADDLRKADRAGTDSRLPCLLEQWIPDSPNRFVVFKKTPAALTDFARLLPEAEEILTRRHGESGGAMVRQVAAEILYFQGRFDEAVSLAKEQADDQREPSADTILSQYVLFRCYLATGLHQEAECCMLDIIRTSKQRPECIAPYLVIRDWANLTTGWSGDTPRFCDVSQGDELPILEDRLTAIRNGISRLSALEEHFVRYAERSCRETCTVRQHYMDIFNAIYWFQAGDYQQSELHFLSAYRVSADSGLVMPFVEYGRQIIPLLHYIGDNDSACSSDWLTAILTLAGQYEESLRAYRA